MSSKYFRAIFAVCLFAFTNGDIIVDEECLNYTVYPVQYELDIYPYVRPESSYYDCDLTITVIAKTPYVNVIELEAIDLQIRRESVKVLDGNDNIINHARPFDYSNGKLRIYLRQPLLVYNDLHKQVYYVKISFTKILTENSNSGVFLVKYYDEQSKDYKYLFTTRLSPRKAPYFFPCFADLKFEAVFKFKVFIVEHHDVQYTNTSLVIAEELRRERVKGYHIVHYAPSPQVSLYQVGFHYSRFDSKRARAQSTNDTLILWAPIDELEDFKYIHYFGIRIINLIQEYSKIKRPLVQGPINLVAVPSVINGYEIGSWNLLTNGAHRIVNIDQFTNIKQIETMTFELAQQLTRIWLGNPGEIERTRWKEEWFKEGMATYLAYYFLPQHNYGVSSTTRPLAEYGLHMKHEAMAIDWHRSDPALDFFNTSLAVEIPPRYKELVTMKTGAILWMLENWVESDKFHNAFVNYINSRRGKYISLHDFTDDLDHSTLECLHQFFNGSTASRILGSWFKRRGYPVIHVQVLRDRATDAIQLKQRQFSFTHDNREDTDYLIPISYIVQNNNNCFNCYRPRFTIGAQSYTFNENLNGGWIILNRNGTGYYRVNYDPVTWRLIAKTLNNDMMAIDELNRAQIVNDVFALYVAGDLDLVLTIEILDYLDKERSPIVWQSAKAGFEFLAIEGSGCSMTKYRYWDWENFMIKKVSPIFSQLVKSRDDQLVMRKFRNVVVELACSLNYEPCLQYVRKMYLEDKRGQYSMFPDCRMSYFFALANETFGNSYTRKLNAIEQEDKLISEKKIREKYRFFGKLPLGKPKSMPIIMSTTESPTPVTEKIKANGGFSVKYSTNFLFLSIIILNVFVR